MISTPTASCNVSAKDLATGKEQKVTITASTKLSEDEIKKAMDEAAQYAEEDKKRREEVDAQNDADSICYQVEKSMKDLADKISDDDKKALEAAVSAVRAKMGGGDTAALKQETEALKNKPPRYSARYTSRRARMQTRAPAQARPARIWAASRQQAARHRAARMMWSTRTMRSWTTTNKQNKQTLSRCRILRQRLGVGRNGFGTQLL